MTHPGTTAADSPHSPPLAKDLDAVQVRYTWKGGESGGSPPNGAHLHPKAEAQPAPLPAEHAAAALDAQIRHYTAALEADWRLSDPILSDRDRKNPLRADIPPGRQPYWGLRT